MSDFTKTKISHLDFMDVIESLNILGNMRDLEISYTLARNIQKCKPHMKALEKRIYQVQQELAQKHPNGDIVVNDKKEVVWRDKAKADELMEQVNSEEIEVEFYKIKFEEFPDEMWAKIPATLQVPLLDIIIVSKL